MGREYHNKRSVKRGGSNPFSQLLLIVITFVLGYFSATIVDIQTLTHWINTQVLAHQEVAKPLSSPPQQAAVPPKPKFEFYTLLTNEKVPNAQAANNRPVATTSTSTTPIAAQSPGVISAASSKSHNPLAAKPLVAKSPAIITPSSIGRGVYSVQVASFRARKDADHMKGLLTLKGFSVSVVSITDANRGVWFRVVVGPYSNRTLAQKAQIDLAKNERLHGMVAVE